MSYLSALYEYYQKIKLLVSDGVCPFGMELCPIDYVIVLDENGEIVSVECRTVDKKRAKYLVVQRNRTSGIVAHDMYDDQEYVLGLGKGEKVKSKMKAFVKRCAELHKTHPDNGVFRAVYMFYKKYNAKAIAEHPVFSEIIRNSIGRSKKVNISFLLQGDDKLACSCDELIAEASNAQDPDTVSGVCSITGKYGPLARLFPVIKGRECGAMGIRLVSIQKDRGFDSDGKEQGYNASISYKVAVEASSAFSYLMRPGSINKKTVGDTTFFFWTNKAGETDKLLSEGLLTLFGLKTDVESGEDVVSGESYCKSLFESIYTGFRNSKVDATVYLLAWRPNMTRLVVRMWSELSGTAIASSVLRHFEDMSVPDIRAEEYRKPYTGVNHILHALNMNYGVRADIDPYAMKLMEQTVNCIVNGTKYPDILRTRALAEAVKMIRDFDGSLVLNRRFLTLMGILKAYLIRNNNNFMPITMNLENNNVGFLCGRLFALMEYVQKTSTHTNNVSISRYVVSATSRPRAAFSSIAKIYNYHLNKLSGEGQMGLVCWAQKLRRSITEQFGEVGIPPTLNQSEQCWFMLGYDAQMIEFYKPKEEKTDITEALAEDIY